MSIIDNLLVLLDDEKERTLDEIQRLFTNYTKQIISASLGRMISKKFIKFNKSNKQYKIDTKGQENITLNLNNIQKIQKINTIKGLYIIIFNIPEKERINRDIMRNYLINNGYGRLHNTVWIGIHNNIEDLKKLAADLMIKKRLLIFYTKLSQKDLDQIINHTYWNYQKINEGYSKFIDKTKKYIISKKNNSIHARCLVYSYAKYLSLDPILDKKFNNNKYLGQSAYKYYLKLRDYCY